MEPQITTIDAGVTGPRVLVIGGIHGNEPTGVEVIQILKESLSIDTGTVELILAHPLAQEKRTRFIERDLNRSFGMEQDGTIESHLASRIASAIDAADLVIDIHNTVTNPSPRFVITEYDEYAQYVDVPYVVGGFGAYYAGSTDQYADRMGSRGMCVEAGWISDDKDHVRFALETVRNLLKVTGNIQQLPKTYKTAKRLQLDEMYSVTSEYTSTRHYKDFDKVSAGECFGFDGDMQLVAQKDGFLLFSSQHASKGDIGYMFLSEKDV